jgi:hypothetical protein
MEERHDWPYTAGGNNAPPLRLSASTDRQGTRHATSGTRMLRRHIWAVLGGLLVLVGIVGSTLAATGDAHAEAESSQRAFLSPSQEIAAALGAVHLTGHHPLEGWHEPAPRQGAQVRGKAWRTS